MLSKKKRLEVKKSGNKNNLFRFKLEHENQPIIDQRVRGLDNLDTLFSKIKEKFRGKK